MAYADDSFALFFEQRQLDFVIDLVVPWYLNFYCSWFAARAQGEIDYFYVGYEDLFSDPQAMLRGILKFLGESRSEQEIQNAIAMAPEVGREVGGPGPGGGTRFNVGTIGRGDGTLSVDQKERIRHLGHYYAHIDLSPIGF